MQEGMRKIWKKKKGKKSIIKEKKKGGNLKIEQRKKYWN